ncbi:MAG TPA: cation-transporting P-type ATPase, partial [Bryobacteraceae bacterium]|nr:cation-transporting P-type ATPase [Bryobacteraceae bacterium]
METIAPHPEPAEYAGLSESEAVSRRAQYGPNVLPDDSRLGAWRILLLQFGSLMVAILLAAAIVSLLLGDWNDGIAICAILLLNVFLGFSQEYRAERAIAKLRQLSVPLIRVRRDGALREVSSTELVPGDLYLFDAGTVLPADGWLVSGAGVLVDESVLTGESQAISKLPGSTGTECALHAETANATFAGTRVLKGRGAIVVRSTGLSTELGKI